MENGSRLTPIEIKSGITFNQDFFRNLTYWNKLAGNRKENAYVIYGGDTSRETEEGVLLGWRDLDKTQ